MRFNKHTLAYMLGEADQKKFIQDELSAFTQLVFGEVTGTKNPSEMLSSVRGDDLKLYDYAQRGSNLSAFNKAAYVNYLNVNRATGNIISSNQADFYGRDWVNRFYKTSYLMGLADINDMVKDMLYVNSGSIQSLISSSSKSMTGEWQVGALNFIQNYSVDVTGSDLSVEDVVIPAVTQVQTHNFPSVTIAHLPAQDANPLGGRRPVQQTISLYEKLPMTDRIAPFYLKCSEPFTIPNTESNECVVMIKRFPAGVVQSGGITYAMSNEAFEGASSSDRFLTVKSTYLNGYGSSDEERKILNYSNIRGDFRYTADGAYAAFFKTADLQTTEKGLYFYPAGFSSNLNNIFWVMGDGRDGQSVIGLGENEPNPSNPSIGPTYPLWYDRQFLYFDYEDRDPASLEIYVTVSCYEEFNRAITGINLLNFNFDVSGVRVSRDGGLRNYDDYLNANTPLPSTVGTTDVTIDRWNPPMNYKNSLAELPQVMDEWTPSEKEEVLLTALSFKRVAVRPMRETYISFGGESFCVLPLTAQCTHTVTTETFTGTYLCIISELGVCTFLDVMDYTLAGNDETSKPYMARVGDRIGLIATDSQVRLVRNSDPRVLANWKKITDTEVINDWFEDSFNGMIGTFNSLGLVTATGKMSYNYGLRTESTTLNVDNVSSSADEAFNLKDNDTDVLVSFYKSGTNKLAFISELVLAIDSVAIDGCDFVFAFKKSEDFERLSIPMKNYYSNNLPSEITLEELDSVAATVNGSPGYLISSAPVITSVFRLPVTPETLECVVSSEPPLEPPLGPG